MWRLGFWGLDIVGGCWFVVCSSVFGILDIVGKIWFWDLGYSGKDLVLGFGI